MAREETYAAPGRRIGDSRRQGAHAAGKKGAADKPSRGLWALLGLFLLLALLALLLITLLGGDDKEKSSSGGGGKNSSTLTAGGKSLLPVPSSGLEPFVGQTAQGSALQVVAVNGNEGFSVTKGGGDPVYVEWGGDVGQNEGSSFQPKEGDKVNLTGPVEKAGPNAAERLKLDADEARLVESQGAFVNADRVAQTN